MAALDFQQGLLVLFFCLFFLTLALVTPKLKAKPSITTLGVYAVTIDWKDGSNDDVDLYVQDPQGNIVFWENPSSGLMHLEHDDLGTKRSSTSNTGKIVSKTNSERVVLRGTSSGEYVVNVHMYRKSDRGPQTIHVKLWRLAGNDKIVYSKTIVERGAGDERTAFRFKLNQAGYLIGTNDLQKKLVDAQTAPNPASYGQTPNGMVRP